MSEPQQARTGEQRLVFLDLLRALAAASVALYHWGFRNHLDGDITVAYAEVVGPTSYMHLAVRLFFMISGFVICYSAAGKSALEFAWARFVRLFPTYWLCVTVSWVVLSLLWQPHFTVSVKGWLINLTMLQQYFRQPHVDPVYYTLLQELRFYAMMFAVMLLGQERRLLGLVAAWLGLSAVDLFVKVPLARYEMVLDDAPFFAAGVVAYLAYRDGFRTPHRLLMLVCYALGVLRFWRHSQLEETTLGIVLGLVPTMLIIAVFFGIFSSRRVLTCGWPPVRWAAVLGGISYPFYLLHNFIGCMLAQHYGLMLNRWVLLAVLYLACGSLAYAVWRWYERPVMRWLKRWHGGVGKGIREKG